MADNYTITGQGQGQAIGPQGGLVDVWRVTFTTIPDGIQASVNIPLETWLADPAGSTAAAIEPLVGPIEQTQAL
jgi:hypothetical protein